MLFFSNKNWFGMRIFTLIILVIIVIPHPLLYAEPHGIAKVLESSSGLGSNDLGDMVWDGSKLWVSGSGTITSLTGNPHSRSSWKTLKGENGFGRGTITALYADENTIIAAWRYTEKRTDGSTFPSGDGFSVSHDNGLTWRHVPVIDFFPERSGTTYPGAYTTTYDIKNSEGKFWSSTTAGFLLKSTNSGINWTMVLPNTDEFDFTNPNHHGQCVEAYGDTLWVGTFQGMNSSFDGGFTWNNHSYSDGNIEEQPIKPGNFCVAVEHKIVDGKTHVWVGSLPYMGLGVYGISHTDNNGETWTYKTTKYNAWNFAFGHSGASDPDIGDSTVFAASDSGLIMSKNLGEIWEVLEIKESDSNSWKPGTSVFGVMVNGDDLWVTSSDGMALSNDWGKTWSIFRGIRRVHTIDTGNPETGLSTNIDKAKTYAFPNPFTPSRHNPDRSRTRIQFALENDATVTINIYIYDFSGRQVRQLLDNEARTGGRDYQEEWDGRDNSGRIVPNGVYHYRIETNRGDSTGGKIVVLD